MSDNKLMAIIFCGFFACMIFIAIFGSDSDAEKEKTKQLEIQYKIDSLNHFEKNKLN